MVEVAAVADEGFGEGGEGVEGGGVVSEAGLEVEAAERDFEGGVGLDGGGGGELLEEELGGGCVASVVVLGLDE